MSTFEDALTDALKNNHTRHAQAHKHTHTYTRAQNAIALPLTTNQAASANE